ncbi:zinc ABC transporter ATPase [Microbacterium sp. cx-55]|uniref:zinc ABC transporter ATPase n=1 Tax=Microbacterium sp. cx-55 TaxID=2875948 RepID=UPI001CC02152|nr:zinc ABC transporter ATPase [Microbacterium sp. cx-55]MBZ4487417.1 zinc ABC transporter ATPase [Microbacterium sp. cx-55]UGB35437.1 zinc ABC transporter ATPase [Microbacterium sp. cx-55]
MIADAKESAPTEPGVYKMPCGEYIVDFFLNAEGQERWLVAGGAHSYTRETVAIARHGEHPWQRLYTLEDAAKEISKLAERRSTDVHTVLDDLVDAIDERDARRVAQERRDMPTETLSNLAERITDEEQDGRIFSYVEARGRGDGAAGGQPVVLG